MKYTIYVKIDVVACDSTEHGDIVTNTMLAHAQGEAAFEPMDGMSERGLVNHLCGVAAGAWCTARDKLRKELEK